METKKIFLERSNNENVLAIIFDGAKDGMSETLNLLGDAIQDIQGIRFAEFGPLLKENVLVKFDRASWKRIIPKIKESFVRFLGTIEVEERWA